MPLRCAVERDRIEYLDGPVMEDLASKSHEVFTCRSAFPALQAESSFDVHGNPVQRLSSGDIVPPRAIDIARSAAACISKKCGIERQYLRVSVQTTAAPRPFLGRVYGGAVVLLDDRALSAGPAVLNAAVSCADDFAALLANTSAVRAPVNGGDLDCSGAACQPLTMDDLAGSVLLGAKLPDPLEIIVPGAPAIRLSNRLRRAKPGEACKRIRTVRGRLRAVMVGGRGHRLLVRGVDVVSKETFGKFPVGFGEHWRKTVTDALAQPGQEVALSFSEETFDDGTARARIKRILTNITLLQRGTQHADHCNTQVDSAPMAV